MKRSFAKDSVFNLVTQVLVSLVAFVCVPSIVRMLGVEKFGLLSILWLFVGYFSLLDFGLGAASVKFLSEHFSRNERAEAAGVFKTAMKMSLAFSIVWCLLLLIVSIIGIEHLLRISTDLQTDAKRTMLLLALCVPAVLLQGSFRSVLFALHRFDIVNIFQGVSGLLQWVGSLIVLMCNGGLLLVVLLTLIIRYAGLIIIYFVCRKFFPEPFSTSSSMERTSVSRLLKFGGWVTVSQIISPIIVFLERFLIGNVLSLAWLSFFVVPNDAILKLVLIPTSLATALLPSISSNWWNEEARVNVKNTYLKSLKFTYLLFVPIGAILIAFHNEILFYWMGQEFMLKSGLILCLFAVGILFHSLAQLPSAALQALGRPDIAAKLLLIELPVYALILYLLTRQFGIGGTAFAWTIRVAVEAAVLLGGVYGIMRNVKSPVDISFLWKEILIISVGMAGTVFVKNYFGGVAGLVALLLVAASYLLSVWHIAFDQSDRDIMYRLRSSLTFTQSL